MLCADRHAEGHCYRKASDQWLRQTRIYPGLAERQTCRAVERIAHSVQTQKSQTHYRGNGVCIRQTFPSQSPFQKLEQFLERSCRKCFAVKRVRVKPSHLGKCPATKPDKSFEELGIRKKVLVGNGFLSYDRRLVRSALPPSFG